MAGLRWGGWGGRFVFRIRKGNSTETTGSPDYLNDAASSKTSNENECPPSWPPSSVQNLWREVADGIDKNSEGKYTYVMP